MKNSDDFGIISDKLYKILGGDEVGMDHALPEKGGSHRSKYTETL
ncbi:MAG: hypothetical protein ABDH34_01075 [Dictyoglomus thermophilum]|uniref:Uncharacterized protein n=1 Tax=Dictyoglomus thermophilum (strain ATCC 35947 / DSM 3960 / H-6-12) TaxID=309799 RepID=B5YD42_DICT6|nr:hypothetical protein DICTH_0568 [Dictyoglomus thermophilum H-6-12]